MTKLLKRVSGVALLFCIGLLYFYEGFYILQENPVNVAVNENPTQDTIVFFINLDRSKERYEKILPLIQALGMPYERISAVEGKKIPAEELATLVEHKLYKKKTLKPGEIGCYMSHVKAWEMLLSSNYQYALVFEDDVSFLPDLLKESTERLKQHQRYWDICSFNSLMDGSKTFLAVAKLDETHALGYYPGKVLCSGGYILNRKAAAHLLKYAFPIKLALDVYYTRAWEMGIKFAGVEQLLVNQTFGDSEIKTPGQHKAKQQRDSEASLESQVNTYLAERTLKAKTAFMKWFYNVGLYLKAKLGMGA